MKSKVTPEELVERRISLQKIMEKSCMDRKLFKINNPSDYKKIHTWLKNFNKPKNCWTCNSIKALDWACIDKYEKNIKSFKALCRKCHTNLDLGGGMTHCKNGHKKTKENLYYYSESSQNYGCSDCRVCRAISTKTYKLKIKRKKLQEVNQCDS